MTPSKLHRRKRPGAGRTPLPGPRCWVEIATAPYLSEAATTIRRAHPSTRMSSVAISVRRTRKVKRLYCDTVELNKQSKKTVDGRKVQRHRTKLSSKIAHSLMRRLQATSVLNHYRRKNNIYVETILIRSIRT